jgi:hypothetical protein
VNEEVSKLKVQAKIDNGKDYKTRGKCIKNAFGIFYTCVTNNTSITFEVKEREKLHGAYHTNGGVYVVPYFFGQTFQIVPQEVSDQYAQKAYQYVHL